MGETAAPAVDDAPASVSRLGLDRLRPPTPGVQPPTAADPPPARDVLRETAEYNRELAERVTERDRRLPRAVGRSQLFRGGSGGPDSPSELLDYEF